MMKADSDGERTGNPGPGGAENDAGGVAPCRRGDGMAGIMDTLAGRDIVRAGIAAVNRPRARSSLRSRLTAVIAGIAATLGFAGAPVAQSRDVAPSAAPPAWIAYAGAVNQDLIAGLGSDDPRALRLRNYMQQISGAADGASVPLSLKLWIERDGVISRFEFARSEDRRG